MRLTEKELQEHLANPKKHKPESINAKEFNERFELDTNSKRGVRANEKVKPKGTKKHKYQAEATERDGIKFPSKKEAKTYDYLKLLERDGQITDLVVNAQMRGEDKIKYIFQVEPFKMWYEPDFEYFEKSVKVVADAKGVITPTFRKKFKLMQKMFGIEVKLF